MSHGTSNLRGNNPPQSRFHSRGRFGRLFQGLKPFAIDTPKVRDSLMELGKRDGLMDAKDASSPDNNPDNPSIPAGFTFLGQFIDHDLTFDPTSSLERQNDPEAIENFRTPALELDNVYGAGPGASRHLYDRKDPDKFLVESLGNAPGLTVPLDDMPRTSQQTAIIADPRNDENVIVSQFHVAMLKFHNAVVDHVRIQNPSTRAAFDEAQQLVRWHYQWIILHEFLPTIIGQDVVDKVLRLHPRDRLFQWKHEPFIPVEFSVAAYRFGHSQVRPAYRVNNSFPNPAPTAAGFLAPIFSGASNDDPDPADLRGGKRAPRRFVEWDRFFALHAAQVPTSSKQIDTRLSSALFGLPPGSPGAVVAAGVGTPANPDSLAQRNLVRSLAFSLPSGQAMAQRAGIPVLTPKDLEAVKPLGFHLSTPPWYYILRESEVVNQGARLGPLGGRIVAEVFIGVLQGDRSSFLSANPRWRPELGNAKGEFTIADLLKFAKANRGTAP